MTNGGLKPNACSNIWKDSEETVQILIGSVSKNTKILLGFVGVDYSRLIYFNCLHMIVNSSLSESRKTFNLCDRLRFSNLSSETLKEE